MTTNNDSTPLTQSKQKDGRGAGWLGRLVRRFPFRIVRVLGIGCIEIPKDHPSREELIEQRVMLRNQEELLDWAESIICNGLPMAHCTQAEWDAMVKKWRDEKHALWPEYVRLSQGGETERRYHELLYAVECKYDGETRHETALRYIRERENRKYECGVAADSPNNSDQPTRATP